ncbi:SRPBCC family protein [Blastococcus goldschmidtiae]|uniref:SRPBCC domain-containing protein n=1 Tax=Blastococcus goldschmidtiae TaxID=3075546 RepID=A0ABU2K2X1_9ACTN|nr:SRPBCC domain-containing protein [Blastococcus sp. DSM 46792]MDT0274528.1 SRPBCC domain-containing protein [Blastococcus sp. DSM 46792]
MQLENSFTVPVPVDEAWRVLLDIERIAPCMPGAALDTVTGDEFTGRVKVKLGVITMTYQGKASFVEKDEAAHRAVIDARGKDQRGNGTAAAVVTATLAADGDRTRVDVLTDLNITGRPAQFGRGVMTDVGNKLLGQFADKLAAQLGEGDRAQPVAEQVPRPVAEPVTDPAMGPVADPATGPATVPEVTPITEVVRSVPSIPRPVEEPASVPASRPGSAADPEPINLLEVAGGAAAARYAGPAAAAAVLLLVLVFVRRRR